jgi:hypothetical protein
VYHGSVIRRPLIFLACTLFVSPFTASPLFSQNSPQASSRHARGKEGMDPGTLVNGVYRNEGFGFSYKVPFGWVDRTDTMDDTSANSNQGKTLLAVFEHPPEATTENINSAVVIAVENTSAYPGLKEAAQYFEPLGEVFKAQGFTTVEEPYEFTVGTTKVVRADYKKEMGKLTMYQSALVMVHRVRYIVCDTFLGSSEEEVNELINNLSFGVGKSVK